MSNETSRKRPLKVIKTDAEWREQLTDIQYQITRQHGTERAFSSPDFNSHLKGKYHCICCDQVLYDSEAKYDSGSGWPSFFQADNEDALALFEDGSHGMVRTEIRCADCDAHLGHLFPDGPQPTGLRHCINGNAMSFVEDKA